jgi:aspartate-semialdehyde dehydrogenase
MSGRALHVAVVGATGAVGAEMLAVLEQRDFPVGGLHLLASARSAGRKLRFRGEELAVGELRADSFRGVDLALFSAGAAVAREFAPLAVGAGATVIDNSSAFRGDPEVPLVVPECNGSALQAHRGLIANPNCTTILMVLALRPLHDAAGLRSVVAATYQAASGAGRRAVGELFDASRARLDGGAPPAPRALPHELAFNVFPQVDAFEADGYTREEDKMQREARKILQLPELRVEATCVRVPVERCHSIALSVGLQRPLTTAAARAALAQSPGLELADVPASPVPQPLRQAHRDLVAVGRVRPSRVFEPGLALWVVGDQLRKGAALNAVQIAETLGTGR